MGMRRAGILAVVLAGCAAGPQLPSGTSCEITAERAPFYKYGPAQAFGADDMLGKGTRVTLISRSMGFSRVMLSSGITGYVSNDDVAPAAPEEMPKPGSVVTNRRLEPLIGTPGKKGRSSQPGITGTGAPKRSNVAPTPNDPLFNVDDVPLPMKDEPKPKPNP